MRIVVVGAAGRTGRKTVEKALADGHSVTAVVRRPGSIDLVHAHLEVVSADILDVATLTAPLAGADAVLSVVGPADRGPTTVYSAGAANLVKAMNEGGCRRIVCLSSAGLAVDPGIPLMQRLVTTQIVQRLYREPYADMARMEEVLASSGLDWTAVRAPMLSDKPATGTYRTAAGSHVPKATGVTRADLADYLVTSIPDRSTYRSWVEISS